VFGNLVTIPKVTALRQHWSVSVVIIDNLLDWHKVEMENSHGAMHRCHIKTSKDKVQSWKAIPWQYCPECKLVLPD